MSKHKKRKTGQERSDCGNDGSCQYGNGNNFGGNIGNLAGILGNIDINQITSLLNASGILGNKGTTSLNEEKIKDSGREAKENILNNLDISQLLSQANELNGIINMNNYEDLEYEEEDSKHKTKQTYDRENDNTNTQQIGDPIVALLNVLKALVTPDKAQIIDKIVGLYIEGKI